MTRVIGGSARGRTLAVPPKGTRPTSDRAREGLFNRVDTLLDLAGRAVLDLYAGSGAVGLEALSRGAGRVVFVEHDRRAAVVIAANAAVVTGGRGVPVGRRVVDGDPGDAISVANRTVAAFLADEPPAAAPFDLIFADPPYGLAEAEVAAMLAAVAAPAWSVEGALVVLERSARGPAPYWPDALEPLGARRYGDGALWYGRRR
ncbi:MAG: 16S rRNA (guanine(966)-N(2))-methyltransferase RsmD [bacterium]